MNDESKREDKHNQNHEQIRSDEIRTGKSCKGYLYYSSTLKSKGRNPRCVGIPRTLPQVPNYFVGESEAEASKEGRALLNFYYGCLGYSVYMNANLKDSSGATDMHKAKPELPVCVGLELILDRGGVNNPENAHVHAPAHVHNKENDTCTFTLSCVVENVYVSESVQLTLHTLKTLLRQTGNGSICYNLWINGDSQFLVSLLDRSELPQPRTYRPTAADEFYKRFTRNANVVASGVARNIRRVGNYMKESVEDILFPYRRPPK